MLNRFKPLLIILLLALPTRVQAYQNLNNNPTFKFYVGYHDLGEFHDGLAPVKNFAEKLGYINIDGELVIDFQFDTEKNFYDLTNYNLLPVHSDGSLWPANTSGYDAIARAASLRDILISNIIPDTTGKDSLYIPSSVCNFKQGYAVVSKNGEEILIDVNGNKVTNPFPEKYYRCWPFYQDLAVAQKTEHGLLGYIDRAGNEVTEFKYLCAGHFKDGVALALEAVPYKNSVSRYQGTTNYYNNIFLTDSTELKLIDEVDNMFPDGRDIIEVYLDTEGSVLSWRFQERHDDIYPYSFPYLRLRDVFELTEIHEGLILRNKNIHTSGGEPISYEHPNGKIAISLNSNFKYAYPFSPDKIACVSYYDSASGVHKSGFIDNKGKLLEAEDVDRRFPNLNRNIVPAVIGHDYYIASDDHGGQYLREIPAINKYLSGYTFNYNELRKSYFLVGYDNQIIMDCTDLIIDGFTSAYASYWNINYNQAKPLITDASNELVTLCKSAESRNIYYIYIPNRESINECVGYLILLDD